MLSLWPWYQDRRAREEIERSKRLSACVIQNEFVRGNLNIAGLPRMYCRGSPHDLRWTISASEGPLRLSTARFIHLNSCAACILQPRDAVRMASRRERIILDDGLKRTGMVRIDMV